MTKVADQHNGDGYTLFNGDCVDVTRGMPDNSLHMVVYSPPFESLYTFSDDPRDMSNCRDKDTFWTHYKFLIDEYYRAMKPGRIAAVHCMNLPTSKTRDGFIGIRDFRGEVIKAHMDAGFIYHSEVMIRKDPVSAMQRSKSIGLLHKQICKDSTISRMALADYLVMFRKPGENLEPVDGPFDAYYGNETTPDGALKNESAYRGVSHDKPGDPWYSVAVWQRYAESVWLDINQSDVLNRKGAREEPDEAHISPLQLTVIRRALDLWSNPSDVIYSPFAGIGSELYVALQMGRKAMGAELKQSYYEQAIKNCEAAIGTRTGSLLDLMDAAQ
jgi:DNA modification methylase